MSTVRKANPLRTVLKWTIALAVLFAICLTGYILLDKYSQGQREAEALRVEEENRVLLEENSRARAEQMASLQTGEVRTWPQPKAEGWDVVDVSDFPITFSAQAPVTREELLMGGLLLVNRWHTMPGDYTLVEDDLASIGIRTSYRVPVDNGNITLLPTAIEALDAMIQGARDAGLQYYTVRGGYRDFNTQNTFWQAEVARYTDRYSGEALIERARQNVAYPGTSEYHTGLSVSMDVYNRNDSALNAAPFQQTEQAKWLNEHGWEYGFVFRFPTQGYPDAATVDKSHVTGINLRLDAYRFVGVPHAAVMRHLGLALEEYIDYLIAHPHISVYKDGVLTYEIYRVPGGDADTTVSLPRADTEFLASTDNLGGLVVAIIH
ncbi:MAG TPA: M15 family metallopeptidase [Candidatus Limnocylindria bacterium]|nr:M15 family metallopeptidase [Candidatus Limnocylindria bacterium]